MDIKNKYEDLWTDTVGGSYSKFIDGYVKDSLKQAAEIKQLFAYVDNLIDHCKSYSSYAVEIHNLRRNYD